MTDHVFRLGVSAIEAVYAYDGLGLESREVARLLSEYAEGQAKLSTCPSCDHLRTDAESSGLRPVRQRAAKMKAVETVAATSNPSMSASHQEEVTCAPWLESETGLPPRRLRLPRPAPAPSMRHKKQPYAKRNYVHPTHSQTQTTARRESAAGRGGAHPYRPGGDLPLASRRLV